MSRHPRSKPEIEILHEVRAVRCQLQFVAEQLTAVHEQIEALAAGTSGVSQESLDKIKAATARIAQQTATLGQAVTDNTPV